MLMKAIINIYHNEHLSKKRLLNKYNIKKSNKKYEFNNKRRLFYKKTNKYIMYA